MTKKRGGGKGPRYVWLYICTGESTAINSFNGKKEKEKQKCKKLVRRSILLGFEIFTPLLDESSKSVVLNVFRKCFIFRLLLSARVSIHSFVKKRRLYIPAYYLNSTEVIHEVVWEALVTFGAVHVSHFIIKGMVRPINCVIQSVIGERVVPSTRYI